MANRARIPHDIAAGALLNGRTVYDRSYVQALFDSIAHRYDLLNHVLSLGIDRHWRRQVLRLLVPARPATIIDIATGTADVAIEAARRLDASIIGVDLSAEMLARGRAKVDRLGLAHRITFHQAPAEDLPFADDSFDALTVAFGVRNFSDLRRGLCEMVRVLRPGSQAVILEFSRPRGAMWSFLFRLYSRYLLPMIGGVVSRNRDAYEYLPRTALEFPDGERFAGMLLEAGFTGVRWFEQSGGIATIYVAES